MPDRQQSQKLSVIARNFLIIA